MGQVLNYSERIPAVSASAAVLGCFSRYGTDDVHLSVSIIASLDLGNLPPNASSQTPRLRSADHDDIVVPRASRSSQCGCRSSHVSGLTIWNKRPLHITNRGVQTLKNSLNAVLSTGYLNVRPAGGASDKTLTECAPYKWTYLLNYILLAKAT